MTMETTKTNSRSSQLVISFLLMGLLWTALIALLAAWAVYNAKENTTTRTLMQARTFFQQVILTRQWNSLHGGVYVPVTETTRPNPYLNVPRRDILTRDGQKLTLINPAYMTRQIAEIAARKETMQFHITSLRPIRPENAPADWEAEALKRFKTASDEYSAWWRPGGGNAKSAFRYMAPLWTEESCLKCHATQGYRKGDLRGGISITIPAEDILAELDIYDKVVLMRYFLVWAVGTGGILFFFHLTRKEYQERSFLIEKLETALKDVKTLKGFIPICASCKKVRNDRGFWDQIEKYVGEHSDAQFSHGICPDCAKRLYPGINLSNEEDKEPKK